ncbi:MAG: ribosome small subunit-dependent GTPase A [Saprospiraceae bacterium]
MIGLVLKSTGSWYEVFIKEEKRRYSCRLAGKLKLNKSQLTNPVTVGDYVSIEPENEFNAIINKVETRKNYIARQSPKNKHQMHLLASNIDLAILVTTIRQPIFKQGFLDRFLITTEPQNIPVLITFNKADVYNKEDLTAYLKMKEIYEHIGYKVCLVSCESKDGIEEFIKLLQGKVSVLSGQSGVGKSSIINLIRPESNKKTSKISEHSGKGIHTTTFAEMEEINSDTFIIDTPGIKTLTFNNLEIMDVAHNFREFFERSKNCKFGSNCTHRNEPDCAVLNGIKNGEIFYSRYISYLSILDEVESQNYWDRSKNA